MTLTVVLQVLGALVPIVVVAISTLRWPTLVKRVRDHTALLKDLPEGAREPLNSLLVDEVKQLAARDRRRLEDPRWRRLLNARLALLPTAAVIMGVVILGTSALARTPAGTRIVFIGMGVLLVIGLALALYVLVEAFNPKNYRTGPPISPPSDQDPPA